LQFFAAKSHRQQSSAIAALLTVTYMPHCFVSNALQENS